MTTLTDRQRNIILRILKYDRCKCHVISRALDVSEKTIRNEIKAINALVHMPLISSAADGFYIDDSHHDYASLILKNRQTDNDSLLLRHILSGSIPRFFDEIAEYFNISTSTLQSKIKVLNEMIEPYSLRIERRKAALYMSGTEYNKRRLFLSLLENDTNSYFNSLEEYQDFFPNVDITRTSAIIEDSVYAHQYEIPGFYDINLKINIFTILSLSSGNKPTLLNPLEGSVEYQIAEEILERLNIRENNSYLGNMIASSLCGIIHPIGSYKDQQNSNDGFVQKLQLIVQDAFDFYAINADCSGFIRVFSSHISELIRRVQNGNSCIFQPDISIKNCCFYVYDVAVYICQQIEKEFSIQIPDSEISLIAVHIGFAIESASHQQRRISLNLYTGSYKPIENYVVKKIIDDYHFDDKIEITTLTDLSKIHEIKGIDLLITTKSVIPAPDFPCCKITPLLTDTDKNKIRMSIFEAIDFQNKRIFSMLARKCFDEKLFFIDEEISSRKHAINFLCMKMQIAGAVDDSFCDSVLKREELDPTCFMNAFAIPHAFESTAIKSKIAVLINTNGISWDKQSVRFVFMIAINKNDNIALKALYDGFADILGDDEKLNHLEHISTFEQFIQCITH